MSIVLQSSGGGSVTIAEPATASNFTQTLPAATGTVMVSGNMPAFSAYPSTGQSYSQSTWTKVTLGTEAFDTNNNFASSTFTPTVAGYYQINATANPQGTAMTQGGVSIYKNGSAYQYLSILSSTISGSTYTTSSLIYMNGSSDYVEMYVFSNGTSPSIGSAQANVQFNGVLVRAA